VGFQQQPLNLSPASLLFPFHVVQGKLSGLSAQNPSLQGGKRLPGLSQIQHLYRRRHPFNSTIRIRQASRLRSTINLRLLSL
jgi:hypothetical protein